MFKVISYKAKLFHSLAYVQRTHHPTQKILVQSCSSLLYLPKLYNGKKLMSGKLKCSTILSRVTIPVVKHHKQKQPREERICTVYHQRSYSRNLENDADEDTMKKCCLLTCFWWPVKPPFFYKPGQLAQGLLLTMAELTHISHLFYKCPIISSISRSYKDIFRIAPLSGD